MLRAAVRSLRRSPGFALVAIVCLALGLGANTALFSVLNALTLRPLPFHQVERLVDVSEDNPAELCAGCAVGTSFGTYRGWRAARSFEGLGAYEETPFTLGVDGGVERVAGTLVSGDLLGILGVAPILGRSIQADDDRAGAPPVVVLSHRLWLRRFGADRGVVGKSVRLNGEPHTVVGVMPAKFGFPEFAQLWTPIAGRRDHQAPDDRSLGVVGRLAASTTAAGAQAEMATIAAAMAAERPDTHRGWTVRIAPIERPLADTGANAGVALGLAAAGFVLLITCANLANLMLARGAARRRETAVRAALGASRADLIRAHLAESLVVSTVGGALGLVVGLWVVRAIVAVIGTEIPVWIDLSFDWRVFAFAGALAAVTGVLFGLVPAPEAGRTDVQTALKAGALAASSNRAEGRLRGGLVVAQVSLAVALLTGTGLVVKSFLALRNTDDLGVDYRNTLRGDVQLIEARYADTAQVRTFGLELAERLGRAPGVDRAAVSSSEFLGSFVGTGSRVFLEGATEPLPMDRAPRFGLAVTPGYFGAKGVRILRGRGIEATDGPATPAVAVVGEAAAARLWPGVEPIGRRFRLDAGPGSREFTVVGVAGDVINNIGRRPVALIYTAFAQRPGRPITIDLRAAADPDALAPAVRSLVTSLDPDQPVENLMTGERYLATSLAPVRFMTAVMGTLGALALFLAAFGLYSVLAYLVARRTRELGIRLALGAIPGDLVRLVLGRALRLVLVAVVIGFPLALGATRVLRSAIFGLTAPDPVVFIAVPAGLALVALAAAYLPARRATRVDPVDALRAE